MCYVFKFISYILFMSAPLFALFSKLKAPPHMGRMGEVLPQ